MSYADLCNEAAWQKRVENLEQQLSDARLACQDWREAYTTLEQQLAEARAALLEIPVPMITKQIDAAKMKDEPMLAYIVSLIPREWREYGMRHRRALNAARGIYDEDDQAAG